MGADEAGAWAAAREARAAVAAALRRRDLAPRVRERLEMVKGAALAGLAGRPAPRPELARALDHTLAHLARLVDGLPAPRTPMAARPRRRRLQPAPLSPLLTKYR